MTLGRLVSLVLLSWPAAALAHDGHAHDNLQVLRGLDDKSLDAGMKAWSKALGVQCKACHVKQKWASDDVPAKLAARTFLETALTDPKGDARAQALAPLLAALGRQAAKDEAKLWAAMDRWRARLPPVAPAAGKQKAPSADPATGGPVPKAPTHEHAPGHQHGK